MKVWLVLVALFGPGVAQALVGRRRTAIGLVLAFGAALASTGFTIFGLVAALAIWAISIVDTLVHVVRTRAPATDRTLEAAIVWVAIIAVAGLMRSYVAEAFKFPSSSMMPTIATGDHVFVSKLASYDRGDVIVFAHPCERERAYAKRIIALANDTVEIRCHALYVNGKPVASELVEREVTYEELDETSGTSFPRKASRYRETLAGRTHEIFHEPDRRDGEADGKDFPGAEVMSCATLPVMIAGSPTGNQQPGKIVETRSGAAEPCAPQRHYVVPAGHVFTLGDYRNNSNDSRYWGPVPVENIQGKVIGIWYPFARFGAL